MLHCTHLPIVKRALAPPRGVPGAPPSGIFFLRYLLLILRAVFVNIDPEISAGQMAHLFLFLLYCDVCSGTQSGGCVVGRCWEACSSWVPVSLVGLSSWLVG